MTETVTVTVSPADTTLAAAGPGIDHRTGCPAGRVESYPDTRPGNADNQRPPQPVTVTRCLDCGAHSVEDKR